MTTSTSSLNLGRRVFGLAAVTLGVITLKWHEYNGWHLPGYVVYLVATAEILGGAAIQFRRTAKGGAVALGAVFLTFALGCVPRIVGKPQIYNNWGNFFEQLSMMTGALIVFRHSAAAWPQGIVNRTGRILLGMCSASFALEQAFYLQATASAVPKWVPPNPMFWAVATTIFFGMAAVALLTNRMALIAARLLTVMLMMFGVLVWIPVVVADTHSHSNWSELAETFAIAGTAWIFADLGGERPN